jgi:hypothetical protein
MADDLEEARKAVFCRKEPKAEEIVKYLGLVRLTDISSIVNLLIDCVSSSVDKNTPFGQTRGSVFPWENASQEA